MNIANLLAVLRARWIVVLITMVLVVVGAVYVALTRPQVYVSTASIILSLHPDPVAMLYGGGGPAIINTELEVLRSDRVALRVVRNLKLADMADLRKGWQGGGKDAMPFETWLVRMLQGGLDVSVGKAGGQVINISYTSGSPQFASSVANAYVQAYMETSIELKIDPARQYSAFFNDQVNEARETLEKAQSRLSKFQQEKGLLVTDDRVDVEMSKLASLSQQLMTIQNARADLATRQAQAARNADQVSEIMGNPILVGLRGDVAKSESRLTELLARYGDNHPQVQDARTALADVRRRLEIETRNVTGNMRVNVQIQASREGELRAELEVQRQRVLQLKEVRDEGAVLARDVENARRIYDLLFNRASQTNLESQNRLSNATILSQAVPASAPSSKTMKFITMGVVGGIGAGFALALLVEQIDQRVRTASALRAALDVPVLGVMPRPQLPKKKRSFKLLARRKPKPDTLTSGLAPPGTSSKVD